MTNRVDRFNNPIDVGDVVAYSGSVIGLIIGVVIKMNPATFRIKYIGTNWKKEAVECYVNVPFSSSDSILTSKSLDGFDKMSVLNDIEKLRLGLSQ